MKELGIISIAYIWTLAIYMMFAMKKIAPEMRGYPVYAVIVAALLSLTILFCVFY